MANGDPTNESQRLVPNKVHIRGLDLLDQDKLKAYVSSHVSGKGADRIEWVNDSSANLVFGSEAAAQEALLLLSAVEIADASQLPLGEVLPAKPVADQPQIALQVRFAVESDKKERGAAQKSRFYLLNPEWDPETEEGRRRREGRNRRYRERDDRSSYRRSGRGRYDDRYDDRGEEKPESFDVNFYDDDPAALSGRATLSPRPRSGYGRGRGRGRDSRSPSDRSDQDRHRSVNQGKELFPSSRPRDALRSERGSYARNRSASPLSLEKHDRNAMEDDLAKDREAIRNNRDKARSIKERIFTKSIKNDGGPRELFPTSVEKELFPNKLALGEGRAKMDQVNVLSEGMAALSYDGTVESDGSAPFSSPPTGVFPRPLILQKKLLCSVGPILMTFSSAESSKNGSLSNRGSSRQMADHGGMLTIKGRAKSVKELFPNKFNDDGLTNSSNVGKELFADKLDGRGRNRRRAGDLFD